MTGRRARTRILRRLVGFCLALTVGALIWLWPDDNPPAPDGSPVTLTARSGDGQAPALRRLVSPSGDAPSLVETPTDPLKRTPLEAPTHPASASPVPATSRPASGANPARAGADLEAGLAAREAGDLLAARERLNRALQAGLPADDSRTAREALADVADRTVFSPGVVDDDPLVAHYVVRSGDTLGKIAQRFRISEDLLARINRLSNKNFIREGRRLKVVEGPFHATVSKSDHLMHVYLQDVYVRSFRVALGANRGTPMGKWKVNNHQENPQWVDPRTGRRWFADDPENPIGEYWIGLEGIEGDAVGQFGYGIHGTIEPETIGQDVSMGCVRLAPDDIALVYEMLLPGHSFVTIND